MGIRGLTTFIARDSERYLKPLELNNTILVVDGNCVASHLYKWCTKRDSAFGGDYDEYYVVVRNFFTLLKKCGITPIVIMDGGYEAKKLQTVYSRMKTKLMTLKTTFVRGFSTAKFFPLHMLHVFCEVVRTLNVIIIQCEFEADSEIAALGRSLQCPVLSYDSDFFIYDVPYIPFSTVHLDFALNGSNACEGLPCSIYNVDVFLKEYRGLEKFHMPILATLLGNDFVSCHLFRKFFHQIPQAKSKSTSNTEKRIAALIKWMTHESEKSSVEKIKSYIGNARFEDFCKALALTKENYNTKSNCDITTDSNGRLLVLPPQYVTRLRRKVLDLLSRCELPSFVMNMITLRTYFLPLQIEDLRQPSSHSAAKPIIQAIDRLLSSDSTDKTDLTLYIRVKGTIKREELESISQDSSDNLLEDASVEGKRKFLCEAMLLSEEDQTCVETFQIDSQLFFASMISWCKHQIPRLSHVHVLLLGFLACQAKNRVGYLRVGKETELNSEQVAAVTTAFAPYRKTMEASRTSYKVETVHAFNSFQSILYHGSVLNTLLGKPFAPCRVTDFYSGTLLYNIHETVFNQNDALKNLYTILSPVGNFLQLYNRLQDQICRYFPSGSNQHVEKGRKRKKKSKCKAVTDLDDQSFKEEKDCSDNDYDDVCNKFYLLNAS